MGGYWVCDSCQPSAATNEAADVFELDTILSASPTMNIGSKKTKKVKSFLVILLPMFFVGLADRMVSSSNISG